MKLRAEQFLFIGIVNNYAASYYSPFEDITSAFFNDTAGMKINPAFDAFLNNTLCTQTLSNEEWENKLLGFGYSAEKITPFDQIKLKNGQLLKDMLAAYAKVPDNHGSSLHQALEHFIKNYELDLSFEQNLNDLAKPEAVFSENAKRLFKTAYENLKTMTPLASFLDILGKEYQLDDSNYQEISKTMLAMSEAMSKNFPDATFTQDLQFFFHEQLKLLVAVDRIENRNIFYSTLASKLLLIQLSGSDPIQIKKTLDFFIEDSHDESRAFQTLAGIQKIHQLAVRSRARAQELLIPRYNDITSWPAMLAELQGIKQFRESFNQQSSSGKEPWTEEKIRGFERYPGKKLGDILDDAKTEENRSIRYRILIDIVEYPDNQTTLKTIADVYSMDISAVESLFIQALTLKPNSPLLEEGELIVAESSQLKSDLSGAFKKLDTLNTQLRTLLGNNQRLLMSVDKYIEEQKLTLLTIENTNDSDKLAAVSCKMNIVGAIGDMIEKDTALGTDFKRTGWRNNALQRRITLLAEHLNALSTEDPIKVAKIQEALSAILMDSSWTFDKILTEINNPELAEDSPIRPLKNAMGNHRNLFWQFVALFYPIETSTLKFFREKIHEQKGITDRDLGINSLVPPRLRG